MLATYNDSIIILRDAEYFQFTEIKVVKSVLLQGYYVPADQLPDLIYLMFLIFLSLL